MKYYVVNNGRKPGIYETWEECQAQVKGFSCADYKSYKTLEEAEKAFGIFLVNSKSNQPDNENDNEGGDLSDLPF